MQHNAITKTPQDKKKRNQDKILGFLEQVVSSSSILISTFYQSTDLLKNIDTSFATLLDKFWYIFLHVCVSCVVHSYMWTPTTLVSCSSSIVELDSLPGSPWLIVRTKSGVLSLGCKDSFGIVRISLLKWILDFLLQNCTFDLKKNLFV